MKHFKAFVFLISFLFTFAAARDLPKAKISNLDVKTITNSGVGGVPDTRPIGNGVLPGWTFNGGFPGYYGGGFPGYSRDRIPGVGSGIIPGIRGGIFPGVGGGIFPGFGGRGYPFPVYGGGGRSICQFGCCQYIGNRCMMCCGY